MRCAWLVAWREFVENVKTKGFWLGIFLFPTILVFAGSVPLLLARKAVPTRRFVLVDFSAKYGTVIREELARQWAGELAEALRSHARRAPPSEPFSAFVRSPATNGGVRQGGELDLAGWKAAAGTNWLRVPGFTPPRPGVMEVPLPPELAGIRDPIAMGRELGPWLRGDRLVPSADGSPAGRLFAAVVIPPGYGPGSTNTIAYWCENQTDTAMRE